jgi:tetratricopeptide (TPR) repeat protein
MKTSAMLYDRFMHRILTGRLLHFFGVIAVAGVLSAAGAQQSDSTVQEHFRAAQQDQQQGRLEAAVTEYRTVLRLQPDIPEAYINLGLVYYAQAKFADSAQALAMAAKLRPGMRGVSLWLGIDDVKLDKPVEGASLLSNAIRDDPTDKLAQGWLGTALWNAGQTDAALLQLRTAAAHFPDDADLLFAAGEAYGKAVHQETEELLEKSVGTALSDRIYADLYFEDRDWTKAEGHLRRALERDPHSLDARLELAEVFLEQARLSDAKEQLDQAAVLAPRSAAVLARGGELLLLMQQTEEGRKRIDEALAIDQSEALDALGLPVEDPLDQTQTTSSGAQLASMCRQAAAQLEAAPDSGTAGHVALAALYAQAGDSAAAIREYQSINPAHSNLVPINPLDEAMAALHQHRYDQAENALVHWLAIHPGDRAVRYDLIRARRQISIQQINRLLAVAPDSYHVHQLLGQLYVDREEDDKALTEYRAVAAARPDLPGVHFWLGHLYWKHGDADHAQAELTRELELDPGHPEADGELGAVLVAEGRVQEAIPHLESAIHAKPDLWPAYSQLGRAYASEKQFARAEAVLKRALAHDTDGSVHYQLGLVLRTEGKSNEAAQAFAELRAIKEERMFAPAGEAATQPGEPQ